MIDVLVYILFILLIAYVITYCLNAFVPIDGRIKNIITVVIWALALIASFLQFFPLLKL